MDVQFPKIGRGSVSVVNRESARFIETSGNLTLKTLTFRHRSRIVSDLFRYYLLTYLLISGQVPSK